MRYFGSKFSVLEQILSEVRGHLDSGVFCDPFGGIGTVGSRMKAAGYTVYTGDLLLFAHYFQIARIQLSQLPSFEGLRAVGLHGPDDVSNYFNSLRPLRGWITKHYALERSFLSVENGKKIDSAWSSILRWKRTGLLSEEEYALLIASIVDSMDRVANTAGTYYAHLKTLYRKARRPFRFSWVEVTAGDHAGHSHRVDALQLVQSHVVDVLYLDPPHNERRYDGYYHLPESMARGYRGPVGGLSGVPRRSRTYSAFYNQNSGLTALRDLADTSSWRVLLLHYSDSGIMPPNAIRSLLSGYGKLEEKAFTARSYSTTESASLQHRIYSVAR